MGVFSPLNSLVLLLTLPIIALYLLRPRSEKKVIPSNFLWQQTVASLDVERLDKRLIRNWLFYIQLCIVICGALFLMKPFFNQLTVESTDVVILIDQSASMATSVDEESRLMRSKEKALELLRGLEGAPNISIYGVGNEVTLAYKGTVIDQGVKAIKKLQQLEVSVNEKNLKGFVEGYDKSEGTREIFIFSDEVLLEMPTLRYNLISEGKNTVSLLKASHRRGEDKDFLQVQLENYETTSVSGELMIYGNDQLLGIENIELSAEGLTTIPFETEDLYEAYKIEYKGNDDYLLDNIYYLSVGKNKTKQVLLAGEPNRFLEEALTILPNIEVYKTESLEVEKAYDLYVYNGQLPDKLPAKGSVLIINPKEDKSYLKLGEKYISGVLAFDDNDSLWRHVSKEFGVREVSSIETSIGKSIMTIDGNPIIAKGYLEKHPTVIVGFDLLESDFPIRIGFPVFIHNTSTYLLGNLSHRIGDGIVGDVYSVVGDPRASKSVLINNVGEKTLLDGSYNFDLEVNKSGFYLLEESDDDNVVGQRWIGFNVSRDESYKAVVENAENITVLRENAIGHRDFKWIFALLFLGLLFVEWWVYNHGY